MKQYGSDAVFLHKTEFEQILKKVAERDEFYELVKRVRAEFLNYQNIVKKEKQDLYRFAIENFLKEFAIVIDFIERGKKLAESSSKGEKIMEGFDLIKKECVRILEKYGVKIYGKKGDKFDPTIHEVVEGEQTDSIEDLVIGEVISPGIMLYEKVVRPALVKVCKKS
jgi:molecular chaperone GrpE